MSITINPQIGPATGQPDATPAGGALPQPGGLPGGYSQPGDLHSLHRSNAISPGMVQQRRNAMLPRLHIDTNVAAVAGIPTPTPASGSTTPLSPQSPMNSQIVRGGSDITGFLASDNPMDVGVKNQVFAERFQQKAGWKEQFDTHLQGSAAAQFDKPASEWTPETFQSMFMAAWANQPTEKGSYMIDLSGLSAEQLEQVKQAHQEQCSGRLSSHLSGKGRSAAKGYEFLKGYKELLVQMETLDGKPYLFLKTEGHTTDILDGGLQHGLSLIEKWKTGSGKMSSPFLNALANASPMVEQRAAENFDKPYGKLLKKLKLTEHSTTTRAMASTLFEKTNFKPGGTDPKSFLENATNAELGKELLKFCDRAMGQNEAGPLRAGGMIQDPMLQGLRKVANALVADGDVIQSRVHLETILTPKDLDTSIARFSEGGSPRPATGLQRRPAMREAASPRLSTEQAKGPASPQMPQRRAIDPFTKPLPNLPPQPNLMKPLPKLPTQKNSFEGLKSQFKAFGNKTSAALNKGADRVNEGVSRVSEGAAKVNESLSRVNQGMSKVGRDMSMLGKSMRGSLGTMAGKMESTLKKAATTAAENLQQVKDEATRGPK